MMTMPLLAAWQFLAQAQEQPEPAPPPPAVEASDLDKALAADAAVAKTTPPNTAISGPAGGGGTQPGSVLNPDLSFIGDVAAAWFSDDDHEGSQTGGHDPQKTGFNLQQLEMSIGKAVDPYFRFDGNIVFGQFSVEVEEAYATTLALPYNLQARAGQFLTRIGRLNATHLHAWDFVDQPFAIGRLFGAEGNRGLGIELSWLASLPWYFELVGSLTDAAGEATARSFYGARDLGVRSPLDLQSSLMLKQFFELSDDWSLLWGLSSALGPNATGYHNRTDIYGMDLYLKYRPVAGATHAYVALQTEWFYRRRQVPGEVLQDANGYAFLIWRFARRWSAGARYEHGTPSWNRAGRTIPDELDPDWTRARQRVSANLTFWPTEFSRLRLQGGRDDGGTRGAAVWTTFLAFELVVGAHGAHRF